jgi:tripartite-type tricarboxylate transporter receptor subunit TctC
VERFFKVGADPAGGTGDQFKEVIRADHESWKALITRAGIKPE